MQFVYAKFFSISLLSMDYAVNRCKRLQKNVLFSFRWAYLVSHDIFATNFVRHFNPVGYMTVALIICKLFFTLK